MKKAALALVFPILALISTVAVPSQHSVWVEAVGEAVLGDVDTPLEVKERARRDAQKNALEMAVGVFIKSHSMVSNSQLAEDLLYASVRGRLEKSEILQEGWASNDRSVYRARIRALVGPVYPEKGDGFAVKAFLSKTDIKAGEDVRIFFKPNRDCYLYILSIAVDGSVTLLLPNSRQVENFAKSDSTNVFPPDGSPIRLTGAFLPGYAENTAEERIKIIATRQREDLIPLGFQEGMFKVYDSRSTGMISDLVRRLNHLEPADWTEATVVYRLTR